jgi:hypothetical protein
MLRSTAEISQSQWLPPLTCTKLVSLRPPLRIWASQQVYSRLRRAVARTGAVQAASTRFRRWVAVPASACPPQTQCCRCPWETTGTQACRARRATTQRRPRATLPTSAPKVINHLFRRLLAAPPSPRLTVLFCHLGVNNSQQSPLAGAQFPPNRQNSLSSYNHGGTQVNSSHDMIVNSQAIGGKKKMNFNADGSQYKSLNHDKFP